MSNCTLNCGYFQGVSQESFKSSEAFLNGLFRYVRFDAGTGLLEVTGASEVSDDPAKLMEIFNKLSLILDGNGRGRIMLQCEMSEICYFRKGMWKLLSIHVPPDPFDDIHYVG